MTVKDGELVHLCRSPLSEESTKMSLRSWIRKILRLKPSVSERVREMTAERVKLEQQRHEVDQRVSALEEEERNVVEKGATSKTDAERKQLAGKLMRTRRDLRRVRAQADIFTQQIDVLGTHIHHLTLAEQGKRFELPSAEDLTQEAAEAEGMMTDLAAKADLAHSIEVGAQTPLMEEEEAAIMEEFKQRRRNEPRRLERKPPARPRLAARRRSVRRGARARRRTRARRGRR